MEGFLGNSQTLLGTIATLAIVCLFVGKIDDKTNGNFIFHLITAIGNDVTENLSKFNRQLKERAESKKQEVYRRAGVDVKSKAENLNEESYLFKLCNDDGSKRQALTEKWKNIDIVTRKMLDLPELNKQIDGKAQSNIVLYNRREESLLMSLFVFLSSMIILFIDSIPIALEYSVPFTWFFMFYLTSFSVMVWLNQFSHKYENRFKVKPRHLWLNIFCGILNAVIPTVAFVILLYLPFEGLSIVLAILSCILIILFSCIPMFDRYWQVHNYSRTVVLKHIIYFIISAAIGTIVVMVMKANYPYPFFLEHLDFFFDLSVLRGVIFTVLLLDLLFVPLYGGYLHMKINEFRILRKEKRHISTYDKELDKSIEELYTMICELQGTGGVPNGSQS